MDEIEYGELVLGGVDEEDKEEGGVVAVNEAEIQVEILRMEMEEVQVAVDEAVFVEQGEQRWVEVDEVCFGSDGGGAGGGAVLVMGGEGVDALEELMLEVGGGG